MSLNDSGMLAKAALLGASFFWGSSFIAMKYAVMAIDPGQIVFIRMAVSALIFLLLRRFWGSWQYRKGDWVWLLVMAVCEPGLYFALESQALRFTTAGAAATINALQPPAVALLAWVFLKERPPVWTFLGLALCIAGAVGLSLGAQGSDHAPLPWLGNLLEAGAMLASGVYVIVLKRLSHRYRPFFLTALQSLIGVVLFLPFMFTGPPIATDLPGPVIAALVYLATVVTFGGYFLYNWGIAKTSATAAGVFVNLIPVFGVVLAFLLLSERPSQLQLAMIALIMCGVVLCERGAWVWARLRAALIGPLARLIYRWVSG